MSGCVGASTCMCVSMCTHVYRCVQVRCVYAHRCVKRVHVCVPNHVCSDIGVHVQACMYVDKCVRVDGCFHVCDLSYHIPLPVPKWQLEHSASRMYSFLNERMDRLQWLSKYNGGRVAQFTEHHLGYFYK